MPVYMIDEIEVLNPSLYAQYIRQAKPLVQRHGGRYLVPGEKGIPVAGGWVMPQRMVILQFENIESLRNCFESSEYRQIAPLRDRSIRSRGTIVQGGDA